MKVTLRIAVPGHYCVNLFNNDRESQVLANQVSRTQDLDMPFQTQLCAEQETLGSEVLQVIEFNDKDKQRKELIKIHQQFGHATADKLQRLLVNAGVRDSGLFEMLRKVVNNCETCALYKKTPPKPAVGLPLATDFNQTVAVDLHELETNVWYLHIIL